MTELQNTEMCLVDTNPIGEVRENEQSGQKHFITVRSFEQDEILAQFGAVEILSTPNYLTLQVDHGKHILLDPPYLQFINHSCDPNCFFDTENMCLRALKKIESGQELTFFYPSTEWNMQQPFACFCKSENCLGEIKGAAHLTDQEANRYKLTPYISKRRSQQQ